MKISFADPIDEAGITNIFTDENGQPVDASQVLNNYFFITNLDYLDDFMGGADSISYEIAWPWYYPALISYRDRYWRVAIFI